MAQGGVKKIGKRSQAVSAKKRLSWPPRWMRSRSLVFTVRGLNRLLSWPAYRKLTCFTTIRRKRRCILLCCSRFWLSGWRR